MRVIKTGWHYANLIPIQHVTVTIVTIDREMMLRCTGVPRFGDVTRIPVDHVSNTIQ